MSRFRTIAVSDNQKAFFRLTRRCGECGFSKGVTGAGDGEDESVTQRADLARACGTASRERIVGASVLRTGAPEREHVLRLALEAAGKNRSERRHSIGQQGAGE